VKLDRFTILGTLGSGSSARVVSALDGEHLVALKVSHPHLGRAGRDALLEEARLTSSFSHPNLLTAREALTVGESAVLVLDPVDGAPLESLLESLEPVTDPLPIALAMQGILEGLAVIHAAGFVHRDVHPGNLLVDGAGVLHLIDFGLLARADTRSPGTVGRFAYVSPEQARGEAVDGRADVFSVGVVWELVMRRRLHPAGNRASTLVEVATLVAPPVPGPLAEPISAALHLARDERPDAAALSALLQRALGAP
jgi:serine/threonine protein kinase